MLRRRGHASGLPGAKGVCDHNPYRPLVLSDWLPAPAEPQSAFIWRGPEARLVVSAQRHQLITMTAVVLAVTGLLGLVLLAGMKQTHPSVSVLIALLVLELAGVPFLVRDRRRIDLGGALVMASLIGFIVVVAYMAGGVNQPIMGLAAAVPVLATLLLSPRAGLLVSVILCAIIAWFLALHINGYTPEIWGVDEDAQTVMRGVVLLLATLIAAAAIWTYETHNRRQLQRYREQTQRDIVTGLANRWQFEAGIQRDLAANAKRRGYACLMLIDIDDFRAFNEHFGKAAGDELLNQVGAAVRASVLGPESMVARVEDDCFALFAWCVSRVTVRTIYDRIQLFVTGVVGPQEKDTHGPPTVSIGVGLINGQSELQYRGEGGAAGLLFGRAAQALRSAQQAGRNRVKFHLAGV